jgi:pimeloyl-ACP methyl ester carboxylesterase
MSIDRRSFLTQIGTAVMAADGIAGVACRGGDAASAAAAQSAGALRGADLRERLVKDGEFGLTARYWTARVQMEVGPAAYMLNLSNGKVGELVELRSSSGSQFDVRIAGPEAVWRDPRAVLSMLIPASSGLSDRLTIEGDRVSHVAPYQPALVRLVGVVREQLGGAPEQPARAVNRKFDAAVGRYVYVPVNGVQYRMYFEEAGKGIPMVLQHTAGSDGRQWRHLLEDEELQQRFRMIAYDLPFHGKSVPPAGVKWWEREYRLTRESVMDTIVSFSRALELERPVYMGCSIGGYLAPDLALYHTDDFRAVIGVNASIAGALAPSRSRQAKATMDKRIGDRGLVDANYHPRVNGAFIGSSMYEITSPVAPDAYRRETAWVYSQGGPGIFAGDLYYYTYDHDLEGLASKIDTSKVGVHFLSGEFDPSGVPGPSSMTTLAQQIKGSTSAIIKGGSHFAMSDDYPRFREALLPVLKQIESRGNT